VVASSSALINASLTTGEQYSSKHLNVMHARKLFKPVYL
jgi:hypothetical protein